MEIVIPTSARMALAGMLAISLELAACGSFGPDRVPADQFNYNESIAESNKSQMLLNLIRIRYRDVPVFITVSSVLTQYIYSGSASVSGTVGTSLGEPQNAVTGSTGLLYVERPTITYTPLSGGDFVNQLLRPVSTDLIFSLVESGWPPEWLLMMNLERLNHLTNLPFDRDPSAEDKEQFGNFQAAVRLIIELGKRNAIETRGGDGPEAAPERILALDDSGDRETRALIDEFKRLLDLDPDRSVFRITDRITQREPDQITIRIRSLVALMAYLSRGIQIPEAHVREGRAHQADIPSSGDDLALRTVMNVHTSRERPADAFVAASFQGYWFYIRHADQQSKQAFTLLTYLFQMQALPEAPSAAPIVTVPTG